MYMLVVTSVIVKNVFLFAF